MALLPASKDINARFYAIDDFMTKYVCRGIKNTFFGKMAFFDF
jgi:hypothetical protein